MTGQRNIFIKNVWDYDPEDWPIVVFGKGEKRQQLIDESKDGDLVLFRASNSNQTPPMKRNKLLALAEFDRNRLVFSDKVLKPEILNVEEYKYDSGNFKWNYGIMIKKVKILIELPDISILQNIQKYEKASSQAILLDDIDREIVLKQPRQEGQLGRPYMKEYQDNRKFSASAYPTVGPRPEFDKGSAVTYALRFGNRNSWKIGFTQKKLEYRIDEINVNIPHETTGEKWQEYKIETWDDANKAYDMEQEVLHILRNKNTHGEIVECTEEELNSVWQEALEKLK